MKEVIRYSVLILTVSAIFVIIYLFTSDIKKQEDSIQLIVSTTGIFIAIIVTYLFSKIFSERDKRLERKKQIDEYSNKLSALRRISYFLLEYHDLWDFNEVRKNIQQKYPDLTFKEFMGFDRTTRDKIREDVNDENHEFSIKGYLAIKEIAREANSNYSVYDNHWRVNYTIEEINTYGNCCLEAYFLISHYKNIFTPIYKQYIPNLGEMKRNFGMIFPKYNYEEFDYDNIQGLYGTFHNNFLREHYFLTKSNKLLLPKYFKSVLFNLVFFILLMLFGLTTMILDFDKCFIKTASAITMSLFIGGIFDILMILFKMIKKELIIEDFQIP